MTDAQIVVAVATIAGAASTIAGIRWSARRARSQDRSTAALIESARNQAILAARIDARDKQEEIAIGKLETALADVQVITTQLERTAEALGRDARLDDSQREKLARIRSKISRGLLAATPMRTRPPGHRTPTGEDDDP